MVVTMGFSLVLPNLIGGAAEVAVVVEEGRPVEGGLALWCGDIDSEGDEDGDVGPPPPEPACIDEEVAINGYPCVVGLIGFDGVEELIFLVPGETECAAFGFLSPDSVLGLCC